LLGYIVRRLLLMIPTLGFISLISFVVIQLPPGNFLTSYVAGLAQQGITVDQAAIETLRERYGLGQPLIEQYWKWISGILLHGDFGQSFGWNVPVSSLLWGRVGMTFALAIATLFFVWAIAFPIGIYSAVKRYSIGDYVVTVIGFIGLAIPNFLLALLLMYFSFRWFGESVGGLFSPAYVNAPWSMARVLDFLSHLWIAVVVLGASGATALIRIMRANLLDELRKPYVVTARAKGVSELRLLFKYPVRLALNPFISTVGWILPELVSGSAVVSIVLGLPTTGPLLLTALTTQDMYLAGAMLLVISALTVIGTLISDILLALLDPRISYE
jgi:peptide/nickel transport system permease protein